MEKRVEILDIWVDPVGRERAINRVRGFFNGTRPHCIFAANPEKNFSVPKDPVLYNVFRNADLLIPDGIGIVIAARILHGLRLSRVPGVELMDEICGLASRKNKPIFVYGAQESVNKAAVAKLQKKHPNLQIAGRSNGYVPERKMAELIEKINASEAEVLFLALGSPRQEKWFANHAHELHNIKVCQGVGGTLDTIAGTVKRAPVFWQKISGEWFYRLLSEPKRINRQKVLPIFALKVMMKTLQ